MRCRLCDEDASSPFSTALVLGKHSVDYFRCGNCGFVQTEKPYWLDEAYSSAITSIDIGPVNRSVVMAEKTKSLILAFFDFKAEYLDYGAGYGIFVRRMRDIGFDFHYHDKFCTNIFAASFDVDLDISVKYELVTAFEVVEHLEEPLQQFRELRKITKNIFFTTEIMPSRYPKPEEWWYYGLGHGQHISFFSRQSLHALADKLGLNLYTYGSFHLLTEKKISYKLFRFILDPRFNILVGYLLARTKRITSLLPRDFEKLSGTKIGN